MFSSTANKLFKQCVIAIWGTQCIKRCGSEATAIHHLYPKGMGGAGLNASYNPLNGIPLCEKCHDECHSRIGEVKFREIMLDLYPVLRENNHIDIPLIGVTLNEVVAELRDTLYHLTHG